MRQHLVKCATHKVEFMREKEKTKHPEVTIWPFLIISIERHLVQLV